MEKPTPDREMSGKLYRAAAKELREADARILASGVFSEARDMDERRAIRVLAIMHIERAVRLARDLGIEDKKIRLLLRDFDVDGIPRNEFDMPTAILQ